MLISYELAAEIINIPFKSLYTNPKFKPFLVREEGSENKLFDIDAYNRMEELNIFINNFCIDMVNFADFVISKIGIDEFYKNINSSKRQDIKKGRKKSKFSLKNALLVRDTFSSYLKRYNSEIVKNIVLEPLDKRELNKNFLIVNYWIRNKTLKEMSKETGLSEYFFKQAIKKYSLSKRKANLKVKKMLHSSLTKEKIANAQPNSKKIVKICPKTFKILTEYKSTAAVEKDGFVRTNVRDAIKYHNMSKGYFWADKQDYATFIDYVNANKDKISKKILKCDTVQLSKNKLKSLYINKNMTTIEIARVYQCKQRRIIQLLSKYKIKKQKNI